MDETPAPTTNERPYRAGPVTRLNEWVNGLPVSAGVAFLLLGLALVAVQLLALLVSGSGWDGDLLPVIIFNGLFAAYLPWLMNLLDRRAAAALDAMRPALEISDAELRRFRFRLVTMPTPMSYGAGAAALVLVLLMEQLWVEPARYAGLQGLNVFTVTFQVVDKLSAFFFGVFVYHSLRQLRLINAVTSGHIGMPQPYLRPLQAFSGVTAATAVGLVIGVYGWLLINPDLLHDPLVIGFAAVVTLLAVAVLFCPCTASISICRRIGIGSWRPSSAASKRPAPGSMRRCRRKISRR